MVVRLGLVSVAVVVNDSNFLVRYWLFGGKVNMRGKGRSFRDKSYLAAA
jgi:hypothetical protein